MRRWLAFGCMGLACVGVGAIGALAFGSVTASPPPAVARRSAGEMAIGGLRTWIDTGDGRRLRVAARSVRLMRPRAFGPFRFGFARAIEGHGVSIESFEDGRQHPAANDSALRSESLLSVLAPGSASRRLMSAAARGVTLIRNRGDGTKVTINARECLSSRTTGTALCRHGNMREGTTVRVFDEAACDTTGCTITQVADVR